MQEYRIVQIMPAAEGRRALYATRDDEGRPEALTSALAGWALYEDQSDGRAGFDAPPPRYVAGLDTADTVDFCPDAVNFVR